MTPDASLPPPDVQRPEFVSVEFPGGQTVEVRVRRAADVQRPTPPWVPVCDACGQRLEQPGALLFGPPDDSGNVSKEHFCVACYADLRASRARIKS